MGSFCTIHLVVSLDPDDVTALWKQTGIVLQVNSEPDMIKLHKTIQAFDPKGFASGLWLQM